MRRIAPVADTIGSGEQAGGLSVAGRWRCAIQGMVRKRDWDRRAPDAPDEPADLVWERERRRRGLR